MTLHIFRRQCSVGGHTRLIVVFSSQKALMTQWSENMQFSEAEKSESPYFKALFPVPSSRKEIQLVGFDVRVCETQCQHETL